MHAIADGGDGDRGENNRKLKQARWAAPKTARRRVPSHPISFFLHFIDQTKLNNTTLNECSYFLADYVIALPRNLRACLITNHRRTSKKPKTTYVTTFIIYTKLHEPGKKRNNISFIFTKESWLHALLCKALNFLYLNLTLNELLVGSFEMFFSTLVSFLNQLIFSYAS